MKRVNGLIVLILCIMLLYSCGTDSKKDVKETEAQSVNHLLLSPEEQKLFKEQLFFWLRSQLGYDENTFVKTEDLKIDNNNFHYEAIIIDKGLMHPFTSFVQNQLPVRFASYNEDRPKAVGDSISIVGEFQLLDIHEEIENKPKSVNLSIEANYKRVKAYYDSPYGGGDLQGDKSEELISKELIVQLTTPRIFNLNEKYLKARIFQLTDSDLEGLSNEELAFLRNEIFARHGHIFKTNTMQTYFENQSWYIPYYNDATPLLNDVERTNVLFIKSKES